MTEKTMDRIGWTMFVGLAALIVMMFMSDLAGHARHCSAIWAAARTHTDTLIVMTDEYCRRH